ncbi:MAG: cobyric acid synthase [Lachnospiraceae bacterium]|nr:cobyric acid synthase [Lachnospiraceae bacterium]
MSKGLSTDKLTIGYDHDLISDITLKVLPGNIVVLIGPNGSGKSTLLKTVTGLLKKRGGVIYLDGADSSSLNVKDVATKLSVVSTAGVRPELMTCREVIELGRYPYTGMFGRMTEEDIAKVDEAIEVTGTGEIKDRLFSEISDGQKQRVMLAGAIAQDPAVLVLDEPTSYLDIRYKIDILTKIKSFAKTRNMAVLMSIHEPGIAMKLADTVVAVGDGCVMRIGTPAEVFEEGFIRKLYKLGDMEVDLLDALPWFAGGDRGKDVAGIKGCGTDKAARDVGDSGIKADDVRIKATHPSVFIMGTMSNAGKSLIAAGLCHIFAQDGYRVAPFKSQNMANNSYITRDGLEMGRAQVLQAQCAGTEPDACMNPILLKPTGDKTSQVVVMGKHIGNMDAREYFDYKKTLIPVIKDAYEKLKEKYDIIVIEGAGSPVEINLKENDIVNMGLAKMTGSPVLIVGDIDRGGVFAQLCGTLDLLEKDERARVKGLIINKFRGDKSLLEPGIKQLESLSGCPVTGVVPYMDISIEDEDSLSDMLYKNERKAFDIAVIKLAHMANFTDLNTFSQIEDVSVRFVNDPAGLSGADLIVIPGTKNTVDDMDRLNKYGMASAIREAADKGTAVIGICGGYQMLGLSIEDPYGTEEGGSIEGLGLLPVRTVLEKEKIRRQFDGCIVDPTGVLSPLNGCEVRGYEIHMGRTECTEDLSEFTSDLSGYCRGNVYGTYVHGLFDSADAAALTVKSIANANGKDVNVSAVKDMESFREEQFDALAKVLRESLDMDAIYEMMGIKNDRK